MVVLLPDVPLMLLVLLGLLRRQHSLAEVRGRWTKKYHAHHDIYWEFCSTQFHSNLNSLLRPFRTTTSVHPFHFHPVYSCHGLVRADTVRLRLRGCARATTTVRSLKCEIASVSSSCFYLRYNSVREALARREHLISNQSRDEGVDRASDGYEPFGHLAVMSSLLANCFRRLTEAPAKHELRGFKVTDINRTRKFGVACRSLQELKRKACTKLNVTNDLAEINIFLLDGALVDEDYFYTLEPQTTLVLQRPGERMLSDADLLYDILRRVNIDFLTVGDKAAKFLTENLKRKVAVLNSVLNHDDTKTAFSDRDDHPEWFHGLETNVTTKEAYMHRRCQDRIRGYLYKTIEQIKASETWASNRQARLHLHHVIEYFKMQLREDHYFGYYFDRSLLCRDDSENEMDRTDGRNDTCYDHCPCKLGRLDDTDNDTLGEELETRIDPEEDEIDAKRVTRLPSNTNSPSKQSTGRMEKEPCPYKVLPRSKEEQVPLCDANGEFRCDGVWNLDRCSYGEKHKINPYRSRDELVLFSTWNLDHKIERSRTLVPQLLKVSEQDTINEEDVVGLYDNLFTIKNLRLVHIICHDKGSHK